MSWITPTTTWSDSDVPQPSDFNRIESNTDYLKDEVDSNDSDILSNASAISTEESARASADSALDSRVTTLEGSGTIQGIGTSNSPTFASMTVNGGAASAHYTGSTANQTSLPIGSIIAVATQSNVYNLNAGISPRANTDLYTDYTGSLLSGTWRVRGRWAASPTAQWHLAQRTA